MPLSVYPTQGKLHEVPILILCHHDGEHGVTARKCAGFDQWRAEEIEIAYQLLSHLQPGDGVHVGNGTGPEDFPQLVVEYACICMHAL